MGFSNRVALSRALRWTAFSDRAAARRSVDSVHALPFAHMVVGHGAPLSAGARDALAAAYEWLPAPARTRVMCWVRRRARRSACQAAAPQRPRAEDADRGADGAEDGHAGER
jgi:hypothetical protein